MAFGFIFLFGFIFFCLSISNYIPVFFGEKIRTEITGVDSIYSKYKRCKYCYEDTYKYFYYPIYKTSKKDFVIDASKSLSNIKKEDIEIKIGIKGIVYYKKGYQITDPNSESILLTNIFIIISFFIWASVGLFFYVYFKKYSRGDWI